MSSDDGDKPISHDELFRQFGRTRAAAGGIKASAKRGKMAQTWWASKWIAVLESFDVGGRLDRGKTYARKGQVLDIKIEKGLVTARVQGSQRQPYDVAIQARQIQPKDWKRLVRLFAERPLYSAKLLAGQMPQQIEDAFNALGLTLFPANRGDITTSCSCPDWSNPCKHVAAVYYLLGEEFDRDPFFIFRMRGMTEDELLAALDEQLTGGKRHLTVVRDGLPDIEGWREQAASTMKRPLDSDPSVFYKPGPLEKKSAGDLVPPETTAPLLRRLGNFPFWRGTESFGQVMEGIYKAASKSTLEFFNLE